MPRCGFIWHSGSNQNGSLLLYCSARPWETPSRRIPHQAGLFAFGLLAEGLLHKVRLQFGRHQSDRFLLKQENQIIFGLELQTPQFQLYKRCARVNRIHRTETLYWGAIFINWGRNEADTCGIGPVCWAEKNQQTGSCFDVWPYLQYEAVYDYKVVRVKDKDLFQALFRKQA